jgi:hypothetical protein
MDLQAGSAGYENLQSLDKPTQHVATVAHAARNPLHCAGHWRTVCANLAHPRRYPFHAGPARVCQPIAALRGQLCFGYVIPDADWAISCWGWCASWTAWF